MQLKIVNKKEDPLLSRTKVESEIIFGKTTPSREEIKNELVKVLGKDEKLIVVKGIFTSYGLKKAKNLSYVYENEESLKRIEVEKKKKAKKKEIKKEAEEGKAGKEDKPESKQEDEKSKESKPTDEPKKQKEEDK